MGKISLIICDDHALLRDTWTVILHSHPDFTVLETCGKAEEAITLCQTLKPDIVMMDINLPGMSGIQATKEIRKTAPGLKIIGISLHSQPAYAKQMMTSGASGYITKNSTREEMIHGIREVASGKKYVCKEIKTILSEELLSGKREVGIGALSKREMEVIKHLVKGASSKEIAELMSISSKTVEVHRYNILKKLNMRNVAALVNYINTHPIP